MKNNSQIYDLVIIGNYTKDTIVSASGTTIVDGGGFNYGAHVAAMMGLKIAAVTRLARKDSHIVDTLIKLGVDIYPTYTPYSTNLRLYYPTSNVDERILSVTHTAGSFIPSQIKNLQAKAFLINASFRGEVGFEVIKQLIKNKAIIAADVQGFVRIIAADGTLKNEQWQKKQQVLSYIDILKTDAVEAEMLTGENNIEAAAQMIADWGPEEVIITHKNGLLVYANDQFFKAKFYPQKLVGRSGRGDTCIGAYTAKRLTAPPKVATIWAAAMTSLKMEAEGPIRRKMSEVKNLINRKYIK